MGEVWCVGFLVMKCFAGTPAPATAGAKFCDVYEPIYWSAQDTRKTKEQVDKLNRVWKGVCRVR